MKRYFIVTLFAFTLVSNAQDTPEVFEAFSETAFPAVTEEAAFIYAQIQTAPDDAPALTAEPTQYIVEEASVARQPEDAKKTVKKKRKEEFRLVGAGQELNEEEPLPEGTIAVYIDIEEAFNKNPWTLQARRNIRLDLETRQLEYAQMQSQLKELKAKEVNLEAELHYYRPFFQQIEYVEAQGTNAYPKLPSDELNGVLSTIVFSASDKRIASPENTPQKLEQIRSAIRDTKKAIYERETYLLSYKAVSREEVLSRQDYIVQEILKEIYSGIKEYAAVRNIGIVVDKNDLIYGKPLNVTNEFIKWMKSYHKKYIKEHGDIL
jgi:hypothetical protein